MGNSSDEKAFENGQFLSNAIPDEDTTMTNSTFAPSLKTPALSFSDRSWVKRVWNMLTPNRATRSQSSDDLEKLMRARGEREEARRKIDQLLLRR